jgi:hypothetical protein
MEISPQKFTSLVHYICWKCADPTKLGAAKLNDVLWRIDFRAYLELGEPVAGATYVRRQFGPVPNAILASLRKLQTQGNISIREIDYCGVNEKEFFGRKHPDFSSFSADELSLIDEEIEYVTEKHTARCMDEEPHDEIWRLARIGEEIPYYTVFSKPAEITEDDLEWAKAEIVELQN